MGLGKTLQSVSMLGYLQNEQQIQGPFLVVVPLSVVTNWVKEFRKWVPDMNIVVYVGNRASRDLIMSYEFWTGRKSGRLVKFNTLITTYEIVMKDKTKLSQIKWSYLMVDEAHRLKNHEAALYTSLMVIALLIISAGKKVQDSEREVVNVPWNSRGPLPGLRNFRRGRFQFRFILLRFKEGRE